MVTLLIESPAVKDFVAAVLASTDPDFAMDGDVCPPAFEDKLFDLLEGGIECPDNDIYEYSEPVREELRRMGISLNYAEGISIIPAASVLLIHYDFSEFTHELRFQNRTDVFVRSLAQCDIGYGLQKRESFGDPGQGFGESDYQYPVHARKRVSVPAVGNSQQPRWLQLHQNPYPIRRYYVYRNPLDQGLNGNCGRVQTRECRD